MTGGDEVTVENDMSIHNTVKPFLKWAGGKSWLLPTLRRLRPVTLGRYHEVCLGGGAHFFDLCNSGFTGQSHLYDLNADLTRTYSAVKDSPGLVIQGFRQHAACHSRSYFYQVRNLSTDGLADAEVASRMIYLNRAANNGLYRVNRKGVMNCAWGKHDKVALDDANLLCASKALQNALILQGGFSRVLDYAQSGLARL